MDPIEGILAYFGAIICLLILGAFSQWVMWPDDGTPLALSIAAGIGIAALIRWRFLKGRRGAP